MSVGVVIFSRLDSRRLPGKALIDIAGRELLGRVIDRARRVIQADIVILATTTRAVDDPLVQFAQAQGIEVFRGDVDDVAGRALACALKFGLERFARLCGDRPFFDPDLMGSLLAQSAAGGDLITTQSERPYPPGLTTEVISTQALERACAMMDEAEDHEHITRFFYRSPGIFNVVRIKAPEDSDFRGVRLVVDDEQDLKRAIYIAEKLGGRSSIAPLAQVVKHAQAWNAR